MQDQPTSANDKASASGIEPTVKLYVRLKNIAALSKLKVHRINLMSQHTDTEHFSFRLLREHCQKDVRAIDAGLLELTKDEPLRGYVDVFNFQKIAGWVQCFIAKDGVRCFFYERLGCLLGRLLGCGQNRSQIALCFGRRCSIWDRSSAS
jgi:hypothetical protein